MGIRHQTLIVVLLLAGCGQDQPPAEHVEKTQERPVPVEAPAAITAAPPQPVSAPAVNVVAKPVLAPPEAPRPVPVDLSLPQALLDGLRLGEPIPDEPVQSLLPPLFDEKPAAQRNLQFNGRLLLNEDVKDNYRTTVDGAELQLEIKR